MPDPQTPGYSIADQRTRRWWMSLYAISAGNIALWAVVAWSTRGHADAYAVQQLVLSGIYVAACAFRSALPRVDLERQCLWNTPLSSILVGRSVATVAELCFAAQCMLLVLKLSELSGNQALRVAGLAILPLIFLAQLACWHAVLSLNHLGHAIEELLWATLVLLIAATLALNWGSLAGVSRILGLAGLVACAGAAFVMLAVDVPMYLERWKQSRIRGVRYLPVMEGLKDALQRRHVAHAWSAWRPEVTWMSLYFSVGVWLSLGLVFV